MKENYYKIKKIANNIFEKYKCKSPIDLKELAIAEDIKIEKIPFQENIDGILVYYFDRFKIFINSNIFHNKSFSRDRFTIAHELGHFFIDEHRYSIIENGAIHSNTEYKSDNIHEKEADYFASCILMPENEFKTKCNKKISPKLIKELSEYFKVSTIAILIRYFELDMYPLCFHKIDNGKIKWFNKSEDFPYYVKNLVNMNIPKGTMADQIYLTNEYFEEPEEIDIEAWCSHRFHEDDEAKLYEYCFNHGNGILTNFIYEF